VDDISSTVRLVRDHASWVGRVVETVERVGGVVGRRVCRSDPPLVGELVDGALVVVSRLETHAERTLRSTAAHRNTLTLSVAQYSNNQRHFPKDGIAVSAQLLVCIRQVAA